MSKQYTINIPEGYEFVKEYEPNFDIDSTGIISIKIKKTEFKPKAFKLLQPYQVRVNHKIVTVPAGVIVVEVVKTKDKFGVPTLTSYEWEMAYRNLDCNRPLDKKVVENNPNFFEPCEIATIVLPEPPSGQVFYMEVKYEPVIPSITNGKWVDVKDELPKIEGKFWTKCVGKKPILLYFVIFGSDNLNNSKGHAWMTNPREASFHKPTYWFKEFDQTLKIEPLKETETNKLSGKEKSILKRIQKILAGDISGIDFNEAFSIHENFINAFVLNSLDQVELLMHLEREFNIVITDTEAEEFLTKDSTLFGLIKLIKNKK